MKAALFGATSQLGREFPEIFSDKKHRLHAFKHNDADICDVKKIESALKDLKPDVVINAAAYNNVDGAEDEPERAFNVNGLGPYNLALLSKKIGATLIHFSTDFVFDGSKGAPYTEDDEPNPLSIYGKSKLAGDMAVKLIQPSSYVIRTACLFGGHGGNFLTRILENAEKTGGVEVPNDVVGSPTYAKHLARAALQLIEKAPPFGTYNIVNGGYCSRYEWAFEFLKLVRPETEVKPVSVKSGRHKAVRPLFSALSTSKIEALGIVMPPWKAAVEEFVKDKFIEFCIIL